MSRRKRQIGVFMWVLMLSACSGHRIQTAPPPRAAQIAAAPLPFIATAYCSAGITASGIPVSRGIAAADPAVLPLGTVIRVTGAASYDGTYRVLDTGALVRKRHVDLYIPDCAAARQFGRRSVRVAVIHRPQ